MKNPPPRQNRRHGRPVHRLTSPFALRWVVCLIVIFGAPFPGTPSNARAQNEVRLDSNPAAAAEAETLIVFPNAQLSLIDNIQLSTRDSGIIESIEIEEGQKIQKGALVARLDRQLHVAEQKSAARELSIAQRETENDVDLQYAEVSARVNEKVLKRSRQAVRQFAKSVSVTEIEKLELELKRAELSGEQAQHKLTINRLTEQLKKAQLTIANAKLGYRDIQSPLDGIVVNVFRHPGEWINRGEPIARIVGLDRLRVRCLGDATTLPHGKLADLAQFRAEFKTEIDGQSVSIPATLVFISPEIDPVEQDFSIWAEIQNDARFLPGMVGQLEIQRLPASGP